MKKDIRYKKLLFIIPLMLFIVDYLLIYFNKVEKLDYSVYQFVQLFNSEIMTSFFKFCSFLGSSVFYIISILVLFIFKGKKELYTGIHLLIIQGLNRLIKFMVKRSRPPLIYHLVTETNYSFPSGHSMSAMIGYGLWILELNKSQYRYRKLLMIFLGIMIGLIGLSRIYLGVHYFSDVIGGFLISLSYLLFVYYNTSYYA